MRKIAAIVSLALIVGIIGATGVMAQQPNEYKLGPGATPSKLADIGYSPEQVQEGSIKEFAPLAYLFNGGLYPGWYALHGTFAWQQGQQVVITTQWTPSNQALDIGIFDGNTGQVFGGRAYGGSATVVITVPWASNNWRVFIGSPPSNTQYVSYSGSVS